MLVYLLREREFCSVIVSFLFYYLARSRVRDFTVLKKSVQILIIGSFDLFFFLKMGAALIKIKLQGYE